MTTTVFSTSVISDGADPVFTYAQSGDSVIVNSGVTVSAKDRTLFAPSGLDDLHLTINGTLQGVTAVFALGASIDLTVGAAGRLIGTDDAGLVASYDSSIANHGVIDTITGVAVTDVTDSTIENWGSITGFSAGASFGSATGSGTATLLNHGDMESYRYAVFSSAAHTHIVNEGNMLAHWWTVGLQSRGSDYTATIENTGTIRATEGQALVSSTAVQIVNDGTIHGARASIELFQTTDDTITNNGLLNGRAILGGGDDVYHGEAGRVVRGGVWGQAGDDLLAGGAFADTLSGGSGNDTVTGGAGADRLTGATGFDRLSGGTGDDRFQFLTARESVGDTVVASGGALAFQGAGVAGGDRIDVSAIDANEGLAGLQRFVFGTSHAVGHLWAEDVGNATHIRGNVAGGTAPEFDLTINDGVGVYASDYADVDFIL